jgi:hypothetical protein
MGELFSYSTPLLPLDAGQMRLCWPSKKLYIISGKDCVAACACTCWQGIDNWVLQTDDYICASSASRRFHDRRP